MALMVIKESIVVVRPDPTRPGKNRRVTPEIGKSFDLTDDEIRDLRKSRPESFRRPVNETEAANTSVPETEDFDIDLSDLGDLGGEGAGDQTEQLHAEVVDKPKAEAAKAGGKGKQAGGKGGKTVVPPATDDL